MFMPYQGLFVLYGRFAACGGGGVKWYPGSYYHYRYIGDRLFMAIKGLYMQTYLPMALAGKQVLTRTAP